MKICPKCNIFKDLINFSKDKSTTSGYKCYCKDCCKIIKNTYESQMVGNKICLKCTTLKSITSYYICKTNKDGRDSKCKKCIQLYKKEKYHSNIEYKIGEICRKRLTKALHGILKYESTLSLLGCSTEKLRIHLESQFTNGMSWENYGEWHIDHIIPCSKFDLTIEENQKKCFHYTNLQPLWAKDNLSKGNRT